jgi:hypothetical protein
MPIQVERAKVLLEAALIGKPIRSDYKRIKLGKLVLV